MDREAPSGRLLEVDRELCTMCGICAEICPRGIIALGQESPEITAPEQCMACGHCVAVCPAAALDHRRAPLAAQEPLDLFPVLGPETAAAFLRSRRSIRVYRQEPVPRETLLRLLEIARFAPTGSNSQGLSYVVVTDRDVLQRVTAITVGWVEGLVAAGVPWAVGYADMVDRYRTHGIDVILRGAPCLIVATAPRDFPMGRENAHFCLEYVELYATALGLGTCWAGFVGMCAAAEGSPLAAALPLPEGTVMAGALMAGYPRYTYSRLVDRDPLRVSWLG
jgi:nitroreductase/NAD-dependent dihydropyrimidine dehydrogenase PreA subunit